MLVNAEVKVTVCNRPQSINAASPMLVTDEGIITELSASQPQKAPTSMAVMEEGSSNVDKVRFHCKARSGITLASYGVSESVGSLPEKATIDTLLISKCVRTDIHIRMVKKSRASIVPVMVRSVTVLSSVSLSRVFKLPAVFSMVFVIWACSPMTNSKPIISMYNFFIGFQFMFVNVLPVCQELIEGQGTVLFLFLSFLM